MWEVIVAKAGVVVPQAADKVLRLVGLKLVGKLIEIPEVWADGKIQALKDASEARSTYWKALAQAAAEKARSDPALVGAMEECLFRDQGRRLINRAQTFRKALEDVAADPEALGKIGETPDDDWLNTFTRFCEDASSERLQDALARILAGEIRQKGSYSLSTLRVVAELDPKTAKVFEAVYAESIADFIPRAPKYNRSPHWNDINLLRDAGFVSAADSSIHPPSQPGMAPAGRGFWTVAAGNLALIIEFTPGVQSEIPQYQLTKMGVEIGSLLPRPGYAENLRNLAKTNVNRAGWTSGVLLIPEQQPELVFGDGVGNPLLGP